MRNSSVKPSMVAWATYLDTGTSGCLHSAFWRVLFFGWLSHLIRTAVNLRQELPSRDVWLAQMPCRSQFDELRSNLDCGLCDEVERAPGEDNRYHRQAPRLAAAIAPPPNCS
jgi:hypothetical protein